MDNETFFKKMLRILVPIYLLLTGLFTGVAVSKWVTIDPEQWTIFFNTALPNFSFKATAVLLILYSLDWGSPGNTIACILYIDENSDWQDKAVAAGFMIGVIYVIAKITGVVQ